MFPRSTRMDRIRRLGMVAAVAALGCSAAPALAQTTAITPVAGRAAAPTGTLQGRVVSATTGEPLPDAQVQVLGTTRRTLARAGGEFRISRLRPDTYEVEARIVGYRTVRQRVEVRPDAADSVEFRLPLSAVALDEVVATGQPGATALREIGSSVVVIDAEALENASVTSLSQLLQARAPGVTVLSGGGKPGQGSRVLMRGVTSLTQSAQPVVYVDGIRIDNSVQSGLDLGGASWSGLDDINPADVDRIEIVRGASAASIYGTEASQGVIQIFTKRGGAERQNWTARSEFGMSQTPRDWWAVPRAENAGAFYDRHVRTRPQTAGYL